MRSSWLYPTPLTCSPIWRSSGSICRPTQVIGLGTQLDTARFRSLIADAIDVPPTQVSGLILGEHGDSMVPIWSAAQAGGLPLERFPKWNAALAESLMKRTRGSGAEVISLKGGAGFAVGISIREVVHAIALGNDRILPVSSLVNGPYGLRDVCISVPTVVGRKGVVAHLEIELWPKEISAIQHSAQVLRETIDAVFKSNPKAAARPAGPAQPAARLEQHRERSRAPGDDGVSSGQRSDLAPTRHDFRAGQGETISP